MGRRMAIVSGKGGVGKTTICAGLGYALASIGASVVLIDADAGMSNLDSLMKIQGKIVFDLSDLMAKKCRIKQALIQDKNFENLFTIASSKAEVGDDIIESMRFESITRKLASIFDFVLIDSPAGASENFKAALSGADEGIVVVTPHTSSLRDADKIISLLNGVQMPSQIVINRMRGDLVMNGDLLSHTDIQTLFSKRIVGILPERDYVSVYSSISFDIFKDSECAKAFVMLAENLYNGRNKLYDYKKAYRGVLGFFKRKLRRA